VQAVVEVVKILLVAQHLVVQAVEAVVEIKVQHQRLEQ
jgi:hypothetical protein